MLTLEIPEYHTELYDEANNLFIPINIKKTTLNLEHSLISLKKWEQKWHKPFLEDKDKSNEELIDYIRCMTINSVDPGVYEIFKYDANLAKKVVDYIEDTMTATWFSDNNLIGAQKNKKEIVTAEIIYYWMIKLNIPVEFQKWHLSSLLTLIKVVNLKDAPKKKMSQAEATRQRRALNAARRKQHNSKG